MYFDFLVAAAANVQCAEPLIDKDLDRLCPVGAVGHLDYLAALMCGCYSHSISIFFFLFKVFNYSSL